MNKNHVYAENVKNKTVDGAYVLYYSPASLPRNEGPIYFRTELPEGYEIEGLPGLYLLGYVIPRKSNLNITTLNLVGPNGTIYSHDTLDTNEAIRTFSKMQSANSVVYGDIGDIYVEE